MEDDVNQIDNGSVEFKRNAKLMAIDMSIKLSSMQGHIMIDTKALPVNYDITRFMEIMETTGITAIESTEYNPTKYLLDNAQKIYDWLIKDLSNGV